MKGLNYNSTMWRSENSLCLNRFSVWNFECSFPTEHHLHLPFSKVETDIGFLGGKESIWRTIKYPLRNIYLFLFLCVNRVTSTHCSRFNMFIFIDAFKLGEWKSFRKGENFQITHQIKAGKRGGKVVLRGNHIPFLSSDRCACEYAAFRHTLGTICASNIVSCVFSQWNGTLSTATYATPIHLSYNLSAIHVFGEEAEGWKYKRMSMEMILVSESPSPSHSFKCHSLSL